ncbi:MAG: ABC transporter permease [Puniceicoccales bacterium]|jgi:oligopeptide transport system permease protein|nr:ABC transporter permease [Puniceicoccales bacterium]
MLTVFTVYFYAVRRVLAIIPMGLLVLTFTFFMLRYVPGGPYDSERELPQEARTEIMSYYAHEQSVPSQYVHYLGKIMRGDLGPSYRQVGWSVRELMADKVGVSLELGFYALMVAMLIGCAVGLFQAVNYGKFCDRWLATVEILFICVPTFVLGPLLCYVFVCHFRWFDAFGWSSGKSKILPIITLSIQYAAFLGRLTRQSMHDQSSQLYVRTARAKGLTPGQIFRRHIFPNGIPPVIAYLGSTCAGVLSGTFIVENLFNIPGLGRLFIQSISNRDYPVISGIVLVYVALIVVCNLAADLTLIAIDPRIRLRNHKHSAPRRYVTH